VGPVADCDCGSLSVFGAGLGFGFGLAKAFSIASSFFLSSAPVMSWSCAFAGWEASKANPVEPT